MKTVILSTLILAGLSSAGFADGNHAEDMADAVTSAQSNDIVASYDILAAHVHRDGQTVTFHLSTVGAAGAEAPVSVGALGGAGVHAYVWPTSLDPAAVGFEGGSGILALAATAHPDFDDTPLYDENNDGALDNDGALWHSHWVVLTPTPACGEGALAVRDIAEGTTPKLPKTWPGLPLFIDSPGYSPQFDAGEVRVNVPFDHDVDLAGVNYEGVTAALRVNANIHAPLLCVTDVFDVASGDLSLPGAIK
ncbi:hypothetical protein MXMO3_02834 [Maritalea myrionectae]|uniref:Uncharacterized protein n=1 Tax=Maritalea myrionectae TaxID=454601 RepID=A0A2R4MHI0_9HYPH|nr:hypothetical protein [Maritalea myrionectae]AVX05344.1 hypothetical protein MXMO3_02834 [Maritalea myrionectae]